MGIRWGRMLKTIQIAILLVLLLLGGCGQPPATDSGTPAKIYRHAMDGAPGSLDPAQAASIYALYVVVNLYDTLYRYKYLARPYQLQPNLAAAMPEVSENGLTVTIRIKKGVYFSDDPAFTGGIGREVNARDFVYSIKRHFDPGTRAQGAWLWQNRIEGLDLWKKEGSDYDEEITGLRALDDHMVQITLTRPFPQLVHTLTQGYAAIVPREAVEKYGQMFSSHPVGSGPFRLASRDSTRVVMTKNPDFRQEPFDLTDEGYDPAIHLNPDLKTLQGKSPPFVDQLEIEFIKEGAARWNAFSAGEIHFIKVPVSQFDAILGQHKPLALNPQYDAMYYFEASPEAGFTLNKTAVTVRYAARWSRPSTGKKITRYSFTTSARYFPALSRLLCPNTILKARPYTSGMTCPVQGRCCRQMVGIKTLCQHLNTALPTA